MSETEFPAAHMALAFELKGAVNEEALATAFRTAWESAELSRFRADPATGRQWLEDRSLALSLEVSQARDAEVKTLLVRDFERPFDLTREAPLRLRLIRSKPEKAVLGIVAHHLTLDGWSLARLLEQVTDLYNALVEQKAPPGMPWRSLSDYQKAYAAALAAPSLEESRRYWREQNLAGAPLVTGEGADTAGHRVIYILNRKIYAEVREAARAAHVTPFLFLLACFTRALAQVLEKEELLLSVPIASRDFDGAEFVLGNCVNLMPMALRVPPGGSALDDLAALRAQFLAGVGHALVPFQEIMSAAKNDFTELHFNFEPSVEEPNLSGLKLDFYPYPVTRVEKPIIVNVNDTKKTYYVELDYQFRALDLVRALRVFTEAERLIRRAAAAALAEKGVRPAPHKPAT